MDETFTITYTDVPGFPAGTTVNAIRVMISDTSGNQVQSQDVAPGTASVTFTGLTPGDFIASARGKDASDNMLGDGVSCTFTVTAPTVTLSLPASISPSVVVTLPGSIAPA